MIVDVKRAARWQYRATQIDAMARHVTERRAVLEHVILAPHNKDGTPLGRPIKVTRDD